MRTHSKRKKLVCEVQLSVSLQDDPATFGCHLWSITEQMHCNMNSVWIWKFPSSITLVLSKAPYSMVVTTQVNCKATSKNIEKSQQVFQDQPIRIETVQRIYLSCQILYVINLLKGTLSILNCDAPFGLQLDQAENKQFLSNSAFHNISSDVYLYFMVVCFK